MNLATLDGKARLAERAKPLLAQIPDGAFGDLMKQRLTELTGVGARAGSPDVAGTRAALASPAHRRTAQKPSLVRSAITLLLQQPAWRWRFRRRCISTRSTSPASACWCELIELVHERPDISTGAILEHFIERDEAAALTKLATARAVETTAATPLDARVLDDADKRQQTFLDAVSRLEDQAIQQRLEALQPRMSELDDAEKHELRELLSLRASRTRAIPRA